MYHYDSCGTENMTMLAQKEQLYGLRLLCESRTISEHETDPPWQQIHLQDGLWISKLALSSDFKSKLYYYKQPAMIDFGFVLSGQINHQLYKDSSNKCISMNGGLSGIGYFPGCEGTVVIPNDQNLRILHIHVSPQRLCRMVGKEIGGMPLALRLIIEGRDNREYLLKSKMDPVVQAIVLEVFNGRYYGMPQKLYLKGKSMELISLQLGRLMTAKKDIIPNVLLSDNEKKRIRAAYNLLISDLSTPPSLTDLANQFSLSRNKLQSGFRALFGDSVFECLREYKMQKAHLLFNQAEMNVSQVAWKVGYTNVSQFTKAYKKRFGVLPKQYLKSLLTK
ncbi:MAG: AraC family transcriptional regulator [Desulfobacteraceae bacterium]|jgi:AraC-like DNA-binding protein